MTRRHKVAAAVALIAILAGGALFWFIQSQNSKTYGVPLVVNAKGLDTTTGTKIPLRVTGKDARNNAVDEVYYAGTQSSDMALTAGDYIISVEASPIAENGTLYSVSDARTDVQITTDGKVTVEDELTIEPIPAEKVTDKEINAAYNALKESGIDAAQLDTLKEKAIKRRDDAIAAKKAAEEESRKKAAEEQKKMAEAQRSEESRQKAAEAQATQSVHSYTTPYFYIDVPAGRQFSFKQDGERRWMIGYTSNNGSAGGAILVVAQKDPWPSSGATRKLGTTSGGLNVYANEAGVSIPNDIIFTMR